MNPATDSEVARAIAAREFLCSIAELKELHYKIEKEIWAREKIIVDQQQTIHALETRIHALLVNLAYEKQR